MFIVWFLLWVVLNGRWTTEVAVFGLVFASIMFFFTSVFLGLGPRREARMIRHTGHAVRYGGVLIREILLANLAVIRMILTPGFEPRPKLVHFSSGLKYTRHRVALADSITLTPGTVTCMLQDESLLVHCLDESLVPGLADGAFMQALHALEAELAAPDPSDAPTEAHEAEPEDPPAERSDETAEEDAPLETNESEAEGGEA